MASSRHTGRNALAGQARASSPAAERGLPGVGQIARDRVGHAHVPGPPALSARREADALARVIFEAGRGAGDDLVAPEHAELLAPDRPAAIAPHPGPVDVAEKAVAIPDDGI